MEENVLYESSCVLHEADIRELVIRLIRWEDMLKLSAIILCDVFLYWIQIPVYIIVLLTAFWLILNIIRRRFQIRKLVKYIINNYQKEAAENPSVYEQLRTYQFTEKGACIAQGLPVYRYEDLIKIRESKHFIILIFKGPQHLPVRKDSIRGGSVKEFRDFLNAHLKKGK